MKPTPCLCAALAVLSLTMAVPMAHAAILMQTIKYQHGDTVLLGYLAYDDARQGKAPGVLLVHEWWGLNDYAKSRARQLAELGYVAFAVDMYGQGKTTTSGREAGALSGHVKKDVKLMRQRVAAGLKVLREHERTDPKRLAAIGYCFGGSVALELARSGAQLKGVVSFHGGLSTALPARRGDVKAKLLVCHGAADRFVPADQVAAFQDEMTRARVDWQMIYYSDAVHAFTNPAAGNNTASGAAYNQAADRRSWKAMQVFFAEIFEPKAKAAAGDAAVKAAG